MSAILTSQKDHVARTEKGLAFEKLQRALVRNLQNGPETDEIAEELEHANEVLRSLRDDTWRQKELTPTEVQTTPVLQDLSVQYANDEYIGTRVMPIVPVAEGTLSLEYWEYDKTNKFSAPDDEIATRGTVNEVSENVTKTSTSLQRRALKEFVDAWTQSAMDNPVRSLVSPLMNVLDALAFRQEMRIAAIAGTSTAFGSNTSAIAAADQWNSATGGDPLGDVQTALAATWMGTGPSMTVGVTSLNIYNVLVKHPQILDAYKYSRSGRLRREELAAYFELDELLVGKARKNTANEGQTASYSRIWPDVFGVFRVANMPSTQQAVFGATFQDPIQQEQWYENGVGGRGGFHVQASHADKSKVICSDCGYLLTTPIG